MDYDVFKEVVKESIKDYMPKKFVHYNVDVKPVQKVIPAILSFTRTEDTTLWSMLVT